MDQLADADDTALLGHCFGDSGIVTQHMHAGKYRQMIHDLAVLGHRIGKRDTMLKMRQLIILYTVTGGDMHKASALIGGHIISQQHRHFMLITMTVHGVQRDGAGDFGALQRCQRFRLGDADR